jgi:hypothetical protein
VTELSFTECGTFETYHKGRASQPRNVPLEQRHFVAWDGEGVNLNGPGVPQSYLLIGNSAGGVLTTDKRRPEHLHTFAVLDFILEEAAKYPGAIHVGFAFNYDVNMIVRALKERTLLRLHKTGAVRFRRPDGNRYRIEWKPSKWFQVTRFDADWHPKEKPYAKTTARIYDLFGFFQKSFVKAYDDLVGSSAEIVRAEKLRRGEWTIEDFRNGTIEHYWRAEIEMLRELAEELRVRLYGAGLRISQWHGPGALASYELRRRKIDEHMAYCPDGVREAARYAYAGGRFEIYRLGREIGPIYSMDINSAYPHGIRQLPSLAGGRWQYRTGRDITSGRKLSKFGVYRIRLEAQIQRGVRLRPSPLFHRDKMGNISYPWNVEGWYWAPEVANVVRHVKSSEWEILEGWEFEPATDVKPFDWVSDTYDKRREWKAQGFKAEKALKLLLNSLYGKMAQRVGWDEETRTAPRWHQLEWAGWVTSNCRAMLWEVMRRVPYSSLVAVETDGLYLTVDPSTLGIADSKSLGEWEITTYDEVIYIQSGLAWLRSGEQWTDKRRGLDVGTFTLEQAQSYAKSLKARERWSPFIGKSTRFIGLGTALASSAPTKTQLGVWRTTDREIRPGQTGKRWHVFDICRACEKGHTAYDSAHDMIIKPIGKDSMQSQPHDIPWENGDLGYQWRERELEEQGLVVNYG